jgi:glycosyltransferase involved in cell wall biosynthesis
MNMSSPNQPAISVLVPMYNEEATVERLCRRVLALPMVSEIIVVDDCSTDGSATIVESIVDDRIRLIRRDQNGGKTAALRTGIEHISQEIVIIQDADLEYDPSEIKYLCEPLWDDVADVVYGSRFLVRRGQRVLYFYHFLGNRLITFLSNLFTNKNMTDVETCYKAFRTFLLKGMPITSRGFGFEIEVTAKICKTPARVYEVPISYYGRTFEEGKKITYRDGLAAIGYIFRYNLFSDKLTREYVRRADAEVRTFWATEGGRGDRKA